MVGDAVIAVFPHGFNRYLTCDKSVECGKSMVMVLGEGINPILRKLKYPELSVKVGTDEGENVVVQYEYGQSSPIDILGYGMNVAAKITEANGISVGEKYSNPCIRIFNQIMNSLLQGPIGNTSMFKPESRTKYVSFV